MKKHFKKINFNLAKELISPSEENNNNKYPPNINIDLNVVNKNNIEEEEDNIYEEIKSFFGGPYTDQNGIMHDISYINWVEKDENIKKLCTPFEVVLPSENSHLEKNNDNPFGELTKHDYHCELKLIKCITEDDEHKENFIKIRNKSTKINKHNDILPYTFNAVPINLNIKEKNIDNYINASYIDGPIKKEEKLFIATQGPLKETIPSFWKMIYNHKIKLVIMLSSRLEEAEGRNAIYWPNEIDKPFKFDNLKINFIEREELIPDAVDLKKFKINDDLEVIQMHILCWQDHGMPNDPNLCNNIFYQMINYIKKQREENNKAPIVVHCSAGVGRTGTVIAIYIILFCLEYLKKLGKPLIMNVFNVVRKLREQRYSLVTDTDQFQFIYDFSLDWIKKNYMPSIDNK
jgi:protein tyrosine phosphatase